MASELSESDIFVLLARRHRRSILQILQRSCTPLTAIEIANRIGDREFESPSTDELTAIHLSLHHTHLPKLEAAGVVEYNEDDGTVRPGVNFDAPSRFLEEVAEADRPWSDE